ncbi:MAG: hypothetical protein GY869_24815 [Planctomycetes bacterium]|nr:hypothetical protein [Planctomycetota bacterium]
MPGAVDNDNILAAANQLVQAVNDLATLATTQNSKIDNLTDAINGLDITSTCEPHINVEPASPAINVECAPDVNVNCGGGSGGIPGDIPIDQIDDGPQVDQPPADGTPPDNFDTWDEFYQYKCRAANWILDQYMGTLSNWSAFTGILGGLTLAVVAGLLLLTVPPAGLIAIGAALSILAGIDIGLCSNFDIIKSGLEKNKQDIICGLFNATNTSEAISVVNNATDSIVDEMELSTTIRDQIKLACRNLLWHNNVKMLFEYEEEIGEHDGTVDCVSCDDSCGIFIDAGVLIIQNGNTLTFASEWTGHCQEVSVWFNCDGWGSHCGPEIQLRLDGHTPDQLPRCSTHKSYRFVSQANPWLVSDSWLTVRQLRRVSVVSSQNFQITVSIMED